MKSLIVPLLIIGTLTAYGQKPAAPAPKADPPKTAAPAPPAAMTAAPAVNATPEQVKELTDALTMFKLDQLEEQTAQNTATTTNQVAQRAFEIWKQAVTTDPNVVKAHDQSEKDKKALLDKIAAIRTGLKLDDTYDWDFNVGNFVKKQPEPGAKPAAAAKPNGE